MNPTDPASRVVEAQKSSKAVERALAEGDLRKVVSEARWTAAVWLQVAAICEELVKRKK